MPKIENVPPEEKDNFSCSMVLNFANNLRVEAIGVPHIPQYLQANEKTITDKIMGADFVGVETDARQQEVTGFYNSIFDICWQNQKPVICCDPLTETQGLSMVDDASAFISPAVIGLLLPGLIVDLGRRKLTRRDFLKVMGMSFAALAGSVSPIGNMAEFFLKGCETPSEHPNLLDSFSYNEFRNATVLVAFEQLAKARVLANSSGVIFEGSSHIHDYMGYTANSVVDINRAMSVYKSNLYSLASGNLTTRLYTPTSKTGEFTLEKIAILPGW